MTPDTPAAALCRSCNNEPADAGGIGPACRARAAAAMAAMEAATRAAQEAEAAARAAKAKRPSRAAADAAKADSRLRGDLERLLGPPTPDDGEPDPVPPVRIRVRASSSGLVPPRAQTCCQCPREKPFPPDPDNTASRCGTCVRKNRDAMRDFRAR